MKAPGCRYTEKQACLAESFSGVKLVSVESSLIVCVLTAKPRFVDGESCELYGVEVGKSVIPRTSSSHLLETSIPDVLRHRLSVSGLRHRLSVQWHVLIG